MTSAITRPDVALALFLARDAATVWKRGLEPTPGSPWSAAQSRELDVAADTVIKLRELETFLCAADEANPTGGYR